jgi:hypothetical protein
MTPSRLANHCDAVADDVNLFMIPHRLRRQAGSFRGFANGERSSLIVSLQQSAAECITSTGWFSAGADSYVIQDGLITAQAMR